MPWASRWAFRSGRTLAWTPPSVASLGRAVAVLRAHGLPVRVRGNGDAPVEAPKGGALLELTGLDRIASVDGATGIARVEAGCSVAALETADALIVHDDGKPTGVVTRQDLLGFLAAR